MHSHRYLVHPFALTILAVLAATSSVVAQSTLDRRAASAERRAMRGAESRVTSYQTRSRAESREAARELQADSAYRAAMNALNDGDYSRAATLFQRVVDRYPGSSRASSALYYRAYAFSKAGGSGNLSRALTALETLRDDYSADYGRLNASTLRIQVCGELAKRGDERCAREVVSVANPEPAARGQPQPSRSCPREDDEDDDRIAALNALLQMNSENAIPILERLLKDRQSCDVMRKKAVFLISQKRGDRAADILVDVARNDPNSEVREQAVFWLGQTHSERSVDILSEILQKSTDVELQKKAVFSLTQNRGSRAQQIIRDIANRDNANREVRDQAIFWLGQGRSSENAEFLRSLYGRLRDDELKDKVIFSLAQMRGVGNEKWLLDLAQNEREDVEMRKKALFWAGQQGSVDIAELSGLYDRLRDREMKDQVIFTLTQRRESAAVDKLMSIARSDPDRELRKKAMFWLGQSRDPRVLRFLEEMIMRPPSGGDLR